MLSLSLAKSINPITPHSRAFSSMACLRQHDIVLSIKLCRSFPLSLWIPSWFSTSAGALALHAFLFRLAITVAVPIGEGTQKQWGNTFFTPPLTRFLVFLSSPPLSNFLTVFLWHLFGPKDPLQFPNCSLKSTQILQKSGPLLYH